MWVLNIYMILLAVNLTIVPVSGYYDNKTGNETEDTDRQFINTADEAPTIQDAALLLSASARKSWIWKHREDFTYKENGIYEDYYDGNSLVLRRFYINADHEPKDESLTFFDLYYDENGKIMVGEIRHYRDAWYFIYFYDDELLYVRVGPFYTGGPYLQGNLAQAKAFIREHEDYRFGFVLEDLPICLENAYK